MKLILGNLPPDVTTDDVSELLTELGWHDITTINIEPGEGSRPIAYLEADVGHATAQYWSDKIQGRYWHGHNLTSTILVMP